MATLEDLQKQRANILAEIKRRGGEAKAPGYAKQLAALDSQIRPLKKEGAASPGMLAAAPTDQYPGLNPTQNTLVNQTAQADQSLGNVANQQLPKIAENYSKPFDWAAAGPTPTAPNFGGMQRPGQPNFGGLPSAGQATNWGGAPSFQQTDFGRAPGLQQTDWDNMPSMPVTGDFNDWRNQQIDSTYKQFESRMEPQFQQQSEAFEQQMRNRGIPLGSKLYNDQLKQLQQSQSDARNSAMVQAQGIAGQNASQFADVGFQARGQSAAEGSQRFGESYQARNLYGQEGQQQFNQGLTARQQYGNESAQSFDQNNQLRNNNMNEQLTQWDVGNQNYQNQYNDQVNQYNVGQQVWGDNVNRQQMQRNEPLTTFNALRASTSPIAGQSLQYSQQYQLQNDAQQGQMDLLKATPRGGGGGGGGGAGALWQQYGFSSPQQYDAYQDDRRLEQMRQQQGLLGQPTQPNPWPSAFGQIGGAVAGGLLASY